MTDTRLITTSIKQHDEASIDFEDLKRARPRTDTDPPRHCNYVVTGKVAHDLEKRWVQAHPATLYERYLVEHTAHLVNERATGDEVNLFVEDVLTSGGMTYAGGQRARLLSDDDVPFFAKRKFGVDEAVREYFERAD